MPATTLYNFSDLQKDFNINNFDIKKMELLLEQLLEVNLTTNLTAITNFQEALIKHIYDSLLIRNWPEFRKLSRMIDIGSGAGFPTLPLAICHPDKHFVMVEATQKKVNFQIQTAQYLELKNTLSIWSRSETIAHQAEHRQQYQLVFARAVAASASLAEITIPLAQIGGFIIFYKGQDYLEELRVAEYAIELLGCRILETLKFQLPLAFGERNLIVLQKIKDTPHKFPRNSGTPQKKPLLKV